MFYSSARTSARFASFLSVAATALLLSGCASNRPSNMSPEYEENVINHTVSEADMAAAKSKKAIEADTITLWVNGLGCPLCASNIDRQLERVPGVQTVAVDLSVGKVTLGLIGGAPHPSPWTLGEAVEDAGFTLVKVEQAGAAGATPAVPPKP